MPDLESSTSEDSRDEIEDLIGDWAQPWFHPVGWIGDDLIDMIPTTIVTHVTPGRFPGGGPPSETEHQSDSDPHSPGPENTMTAQGQGTGGPSSTPPPTPKHKRRQAKRHAPDTPGDVLGATDDDPLAPSPASFFSKHHHPQPPSIQAQDQQDAFTTSLPPTPTNDEVRHARLEGTS